MFIYLIIFYLTQLFNFTFSASTLNAANNKGPCYDITADNYLPNSNICPNEAENVDDPDTPTEKLCSTTTNGRFNLIGLLRNGNAVTDINKERNENCEKQGF